MEESTAIGRLQGFEEEEFKRVISIGAHNDDISYLAAFVSEWNIAELSGFAQVNAETEDAFEAFMKEEPDDKYICFTVELCFEDSGMEKEMEKQYF